MVKLFIIICLAMLSLKAFTRDVKLESIPAYFDLAEKDIQLPNLEIAEVSIVPNSFEWFRQDNHLVLPHALIEIRLKDSKNVIDLYYKDQFYLINFGQDKPSTTIQYSLYEPYPIKIYKNKKLYKEIKIIVKSKQQIIDYRCDRYQLKLSQVDIPLSISCHTYPYGSFGKEKNQIDIYLTSPELDIDVQKRLTLAKSSNIEFFIKSKKIKLSIKIPDRYQRLRTAIGFGPYAFKGQEEAEKETEIAGSLMLYGAYEFNPDVSIKFFDALVANKAIFNNGGIYLSNNISKIFDERLIFNTLLGAQILSFSADDGKTFYTESIYPQGLEATWYNPLGKKNFLVSAGIFLNLTAEYDYQNSWIRWGGKGVYYELNYINWQKDERLAKMWGVSMILPFLSFF